jgi:hypothetical protein
MLSRHLRLKTKLTPPVKEDINLFFPIKKNDAYIWTYGNINLREINKTMKISHKSTNDVWEIIKFLVVAMPYGEPQI